MTNLDMSERMKILSNKYGWKDGDTLSMSQTGERIEIIRKEDPELWEHMRKDAHMSATRSLMGS